MVICQSCDLLWNPWGHSSWPLCESHQQLVSLTGVRIRAIWTPARRPGCFIYFKSHWDGLKHSLGKDVQAKQIAALQAAAWVHGSLFLCIHGTLEPSRDCGHGRTDSRQNSVTREIISVPKLYKSHAWPSDGIASGTDRLPSMIWPSLDYLWFMKVPLDTSIF